MRNSKSIQPMTWWRDDGKYMYADEKGRVREASGKVWESSGYMYHLCMATAQRDSGRVYKWKPRKKNPVSCPRCRYRFDWPYEEG